MQLLKLLGKMLAITTAVKKAKTIGKQVQGLYARPEGVRIKAKADLYEFGLVDVITFIDRDSFVELAQTMMKCNAKASIKAFTAVQAAFDSKQLS
jgi:hypothetical protein